MFLLLDNNSLPKWSMLGNKQKATCADSQIAFLNYMRFDYAPCSSISVPSGVRSVSCDERSRRMLRSARRYFIQLRIVDLPAVLAAQLAQMCSSNRSTNQVLYVLLPPDDFALTHLHTWSTTRASFLNRFH